jgi:tetratricopeptide (TPR) repeat protein
MPNLEKHDDRQNGADDGYLRACEGILRTEFGRRRFDVTAKAIEQLSAEIYAPALHSSEDVSNKSRSVFARFRSFLVPAVGFALVCLAALVWFYGRTSKFERIGQAVTVVGYPSIRSHGKLAPLDSLTPVNFGDHIETGDADRVEISFNDGTALQLGENTVLDLPQPRNSGQSFSRPPELLLRRGRIWTKVQKSTNATPYAIKTDAATALARGTEFGVQLRRTSGTNAQRSTLDFQRETLLTVKEGTVDFFNSLGRVQASAMRESTARPGIAPTEPRRLQSLQSFQLASGSSWEVSTSPLSWPSAGEKLAPGGGVVGLHLRNPLSPASGNSTTGPQVVFVHRGSPAELAGLHPGDVILALEGQPITNSSQFTKEILLRGNTTVPLQIRRGQGETSLRLEIAFSTNSFGRPLAPDAATQLAALARKWADALSSVGSALERKCNDEILHAFSDNPLRAAACNNLAVLFEIEDALGPAIRAYGRAAYIDPEIPLYHYNLSLALRKVGSLERALEEMQTAAHLIPQPFALAEKITELQSLLGWQDEALALVEESLRANPNRHGLWELKSQLLARVNRFAEARTAALRAISLEPDCAVAHGQLAGVLHDDQQLKEAEQEYRRALELDPFNPVLRVDFAVLLQDLNSFSAAEQSFRRAVELRPNFPIAWRNLGKLLLQTGRLAEANSALAKVAELEPEDPQAYLLLGMISVRQNELDQAERFYRQALARSPTSADTYNALSLLMSRRGDLEQAEVFGRNAVQLDPASAQWHSNLADVYWQRGDTQNAERSYRKVIALNPNDRVAQVNLGILCAKRREFIEAEHLLRNVFEHATNAPLSVRMPALLNLANACAAQGRADEAEQLYRRAFSIDPEDPQLFNYYADFLVSHERSLDDALAFAKRAAQALPNDPNVLDTLGWVHFHRAELAEAERVLLKALEMGDPNAAAEIREHLQAVRLRKASAGK